MFITTGGGGGPTTASTPDQSLSRPHYARHGTGGGDARLKDDERRDGGRVSGEQVKTGDSET